MLRDLVGNQKANEIMVEVEDLVDDLQQLGWKEVRPWGEFFATFKVPQWTKQHLEERVTTNFLHYRSNYFLLCVALFIVQLIFSPVIIFTAIVIACIYVGLFTFVKNNTRIGDLIITLKIKQYLFLGSSALLLVLSGSLTRLAWMLLSCIAVCGGHMIFRPRNMTAKANKMYEDMKLNGYDIKTIFQFSSMGSGSTSPASFHTQSRIESYNNDKPLYESKVSSSSPLQSKIDLEDPPTEDDIPPNTPYSTNPAGFSTNLPDTSGSMRKRNAVDYDYKHK